MLLDIASPFIPAKSREEAAFQRATKARNQIILTSGECEISSGGQVGVGHQHVATWLDQTHLFATS
jgi:hypothetical protein